MIDNNLLILKKTDNWLLHWPKMYTVPLSLEGSCLQFFFTKNNTPSGVYCRCCDHWDGGWYCCNLSISSVETPAEAAPMCIVFVGNYFRWQGRHRTLMLSDWVPLNYSNAPFRSLSHSPGSFIKSEGEWFVNGLHFMAQWVVEKTCDMMEVSEYKTVQRMINSLCSSIQ